MKYVRLSKVVILFGVELSFGNVKKIRRVGMNLRM